MSSGWCGVELTCGCCSQEMALSVVVSVLNSTKSTDIPALVASLSPVDQVRCPLFPCADRS